MKRQSKMNLGLSFRGIGYHVAAWRHPSVDPAVEQGFDFYLHCALKAEAAKFDMVFFPDGAAIRDSGSPETWSRLATLARLEPIMLLAALASTTKRIGLAATMSTTYNAPYNVARHFATLDLISHGRACWNAVTSWSTAEANNFGLTEQIEKDLRYESAREFIDVVLGLWDSWEDDAFLYDKKNARFHDPAKLHRLNHKGKYFSVAGPLNVAPSPQGRPILCQAGASDAGQEMAAANADVVFCSADTLEQAQKFYSSVKGKLKTYGRSPEQLKVIPGVAATIGRTQKQAEEKYHELQSYIAPEVGKEFLSTYCGDLSKYSVDDPLSVVENKEFLSIGNTMIRSAREKNLTIRQTYEMFAAGRGHLNVVSTPDKVADMLEEWFKTGGADGFNLAPPYPEAIDDFMEMVVPILQERHLFRTEYEGETLRENLGLDYPVNRYAR